MSPWRSLTSANASVVANVFTISSSSVTLSVFVSSAIVAPIRHFPPTEPQRRDSATRRPLLLLNQNSVLKAFSLACTFFFEIPTLVAISCTVRRDRARAIISSSETLRIFAVLLFHHWPFKVAFLHLLRRASAPPVEISPELRDSLGSLPVNELELLKEVLPDISRVRAPSRFATGRSTLQHKPPLPPSRAAQ